MFKQTTAKTPEEYISKIEDPKRQADIKSLDQFIRQTVPKLKPFIMAGMIGYGRYHYKYQSGREGDWAIISLASQKNYISLYACAVDGDKYVSEIYKAKFPKASIGRSCIRFKKLEDIDLNILKEVLLKNEKLMKKDLIND